MNSVVKHPVMLSEQEELDQLSNTGTVHDVDAAAPSRAAVGGSSDAASSLPMARTASASSVNAATYDGRMSASSSGRRLYPASTGDANASEQDGAPTSIPLSRSDSRKKHKPFACTHPGCGKSFGDQPGLTRHITVSHGERPFACEYEGCGRRFYDAAKLRRHHGAHERLMLVNRQSGQLRTAFVNIADQGPLLSDRTGSCNSSANNSAPTTPPPRSPSTMAANV